MDVDGEIDGGGNGAAAWRMQVWTPAAESGIQHRHMHVLGAGFCYYSVEARTGTLLCAQVTSLPSLAWA